MQGPRSHPLFKIREEVVIDKYFQERLKEAMAEWEIVQNEGLPVLSWLELIVTPGKRKIAKERSKEIKS